MKNVKSEAFGRFLKCQEQMYDVALRELQDGKKQSHWMWYIFPQLRGLARSRKSFVFGIVNMDYAKAYLSHPVLGPRLIACCQALLVHKDKKIADIMGETDRKKLQSCATLFSLVSEENSVFHQLLERFFDGHRDALTLGLASGCILDFTYRKYLTGVT